jgi:hypothetical protein
MTSRYREVKDETIIQYKMMKQILEKLSDDSLREQLFRSLDELRKANEFQQDMFKASQESYKESLEELVESIKSLAECSQKAPDVISEAPPPVNVEAIVEKVFNLTNKKPSYTFKIERDFEGRLAGITAIPSEE